MPRPEVRRYVVLAVRTQREDRYAGIAKREQGLGREMGPGARVQQQRRRALVRDGLRGGADLADFYSLSAERGADRLRRPRGKVVKQVFHGRAAVESVCTRTESIRARAESCEIGLTPLITLRGRRLN